MRLDRFLVFVLFIFPLAAQASDFDLGFGLGYGGAGIAKVDTVGSENQVVQRSEGPGTLSLYADYLVSDSLGLGFEHSRGFRLGPFSSGVGFTGFTGRWYFRTPAPSVEKKTSNESTLLIKQYSFFIGPAIGVAGGNITRDDDVVPSVSSSGVYIGYVIGADYPIAPGLVVRTQITSYSTFSSSSVNSPASLDYFSFSSGFYFFL